MRRILKICKKCGKKYSYQTSGYNLGKFNANRTRDLCPEHAKWIIFWRKLLWKITTPIKNFFRKRRKSTQELYVMGKCIPTPMEKPKLGILFWEYKYSKEGEGN